MTLVLERSVPREDESFIQIVGLEEVSVVFFFARHTDVGSVINQLSLFIFIYGCELNCV